jgi:signal transduction histidine kinase
MARLARRALSRPVAADVARALLATAVTVGLTLVYNSRGSHSPRPVDAAWVVLLVLASLPAGLARVAPSAAAAGALTVAFIGTVLDFPMGAPFVLALVLVGYGASRSDARRGGAIAVLSGGVIALTALVSANHDQVIATVGGFAVGLVPALFAERLRAMRIAARDAADRAQRIEELRDLDVQRAVAGERLRIARDLHDITGHHLSAIALQVGGAMSTTHDVEAAAALRRIHDLTREALNQTRQAVGLLREDSEQVAITPLPRLDAVEQLIALARDTGIDATVKTTGTVRDLPELVEVCAYRVVQESITNVMRHARAHVATVELSFGRSELTIVVQDDGADAARPGRPGAGLTGMRERVELVGGTLSAGPHEHGWRVRATLPLAADR